MIFSVIIDNLLFIKLKYKATMFFCLFLCLNFFSFAQNGMFIPSFDDALDNNLKELRDTLKYNLFLERTVYDFNGIFNIDEDINIVLTQGNEINAFYDDNSKMIIITYELINYLFESFKDKFSLRNELIDAVSNMAKLILFHEVCHCLLDIYQLPVNSWENDETTDELMTFLLSKIDDNYKIKNHLLEALKQFYYVSSLESSNIDDFPYWDERCMDRKRFFQIICWLYGSDEIKYAYLTEKGILPREIIGRCNGDYKTIFDKWNIYLKKLLK